MPHLALDPSQAVAIDFGTFTFPKVTLMVRTSGEDVLMLVQTTDREFLLHDREFPRHHPELITAVLTEVELFNTDPFTGWRELFTAAFARETEAISEERELLHARSVNVSRASLASGFAVLHARREARTPAVMLPSPLGLAAQADLVEVGLIDVP